MTQLKLSHFLHIVRRQSPLGKTVMLGIEGGRKGGRLNMRWISIKEGRGRSLLLLSGAIEDRMLWTPLVTGRRSRLDGV